MKLLTWRIPFLYCVTALTASGAMQVTWTVSPSAPTVGAQYTIVASAQDPAGVLMISAMRLYRLSTYITSDDSSVWSNSLATTQNESLAGTVTYTATVDTHNQQNGAIDSVSFSFDVVVTGGNAPVVYWRVTSGLLNPSSAEVGVTYMIEAEATDPNGDLATVNIYESGQGLIGTKDFAFANWELNDGTPAGYGGWSGNPSNTWEPTTAPGTRTYTALARDIAGNESYVDAPLVVQIHGPNAPAYDPSEYFVSNPYINQPTDVTFGFTDQDGDLKRVSSLLTGTNSSFKDAAPPGAASLIHTIYSHPNPGPLISFQAYWTFGLDYAEHETWVFSAIQLQTQNREVDLPSLTATTTTMQLGQSVTLGSYITDQDDNESAGFLHYRKWDDSIGDWGTWTAISDYQFVNGQGGSSILFDWSPPEVGTYEVRARGDDPYSYKFSNIVTVEVEIPEDPNPPAPVTGLTLGQFDYSSMRITWNEPAPEEMEDIREFELFWGLQGSALNSDPAVVPKNFVSVVKTNLAAGTAYDARMRAVDIWGKVSDYSATVTGSTLDTAVAPAALKASFTSLDSLDLSWQPPGDGRIVNGYEVMIDGTIYVVPLSGGVPQLGYAATGLSPNAAHTVRVRSINETGSYSAWSESVTVQSIVGTLPGEVSVDNKGAANYTVPLALPSGRGGLQPSLALTYNSHAGNGVLGVGWSLSTGFPQAITRGRSILARDGVVKGVSFDDTNSNVNLRDKFYLDGKRLICVSGAYGEPGSVYRTEVDSFVTIATTGTSGNIETFTLTDKSGTTMVFGKHAGTADAYQMGEGESAGKAYTYALKRVEDTLGNYVDFQYTSHGNGEHHLDQISYTGNQSIGIQPVARVKFHYNLNVVPGNPAGSTERIDETSRYVATRLFKETRRLDRIVAELDSGTGFPTFARYDLGYNYAPNHGPTRMVSVQPMLRDFSDVGSNTLRSVPSTTFTWSDSSVSYTTTPPPDGNLYWGYFDPEMPEHFAFGDVNGDGKDDHVGFGWSVVASLSDGSGGFGSGFSAAVSMTPNIGKLGDVNGDGKKDVIYGSINYSTGQLRLWCLTSTGTSFVPLVGGGSPTEIYSGLGDFTGLNYDGTPGSESVFADYRAETAGGLTNRIAVADFTGDGRDDVLIHRFDGTLKLLKNEGTTFTASTYSVGATPLYGEGIFSGWFPHIEFHGYRFVTVGVSMIPCELNGDGITDYAWSETRDNVEIDPSFGVSSTQSYWAMTSLPGGGFSAKASVASDTWEISQFIPNGGWIYRQSSFAVMPGDVNGDGLTDFTVLLPDETETVPGYPGYYQFLLRHLVYLSKGSSGTPQFASIEPISTATINVGGNQVRPWYDKIPFTLWESEFTMPQLGSAFDDKKKAVHALGTNSGDGVTMCDVNLDGREDYVWYVVAGTSPGWYVMYSLDTGLSQPQPVPLGWLAPDQIDQPGTQYNGIYRSAQMALDLNGDGIRDYAYAKHQVREAPNIVGYHISSAPRGDQIVSVLNGVGRSTGIAYAPLTSDGVYTPGVGVNYPIRDLRNATYVVSDVFKDSGASGSSAHFSYQYSGNRLDLSGRGPLGFHSFVTLDHQTNLFKYQFLTQSFPMTGLTAREQTYRYWESGGGSQVNFRLISSHDNTVVFDEVVKSPTDSTPWGTVYPFMSRAVESRWEDDTVAHFDYTTTELNNAPESAAELLFPETRPSGAHITITAESWFDEQPQGSPVQTTLPGVFKPSDADPSTGANVVVGYASYGDFDALTFPRKITFGNLRQLKTDFGGGYTETVATTYKPSQTIGGVVTLTGLVDTVATSVASPGYGTETAPTTSYTYVTGTPLVATETIDATDNKLDLTTTYARDSLGRVTATQIAGYNNPGPEGASVVGSFTAENEQHIGTFNTSTVDASGFDDRFDLPRLTRDTYSHLTTTDYHAFLALPVSVTDANNAEITTAYDALGRAINVTDVLKGLSTNTAFAWTTSGASDWNKTQTVTPPSGHTGVASGAPITGVVGVTVSSVYAVRTTATVQPPATAYFDRLGRQIRIIKEGFNNQQTITDTAYNSLGQVIAVSLPYPEGGTVHWTKTAYDALGRVATVTAPNGTVTTNSYHGRATAVTVDATDRDPQTNVTLVDAKGLTVKVWNADNVPSLSGAVTDIASPAPSIQYVLDGFGRMRETILKDQSQHILADYDELGRQTYLNDPDKGAWSYLNNALGHVVKQTDARGNVTRSTFDRLGRALGRETREPASGPVETARWFYYDSADNPALHLVDHNASVDVAHSGWIGAIQREESETIDAPGYAPPFLNEGNSTVQSATVHYYDTTKGLPSLDVSLVDGKWFYTQTQYDAFARVRDVGFFWKTSSFDGPDAWREFRYTYGYDDESYPLTVFDNAGRTWWQVVGQGYDHLDRPIEVKKGNALWTQRTYDQTDGLLTAIATGTSPGSSNVQNLSFGWDGLGNLRQRAGSGGTEDFDYDNLNRLTSSSKHGLITYFANGNIRRKPDVTGAQPADDFGYNPNPLDASGQAITGRTLPHAVASAWGYSMTYDANGNMLGRSGNGHTWNTRWAGFDKPRWLAKDEQGSEFHYNASRRRVIQLEFDSMQGDEPLHYTKKRLYALGSALEVEYRNTLTSSPNHSWQFDEARVYVPAPDGTVGAISFNAEQVAEARVYHHDHLGSIERVTPYGSSSVDLDGETRPTRYSYDPWGERRDPDDWLGKPVATAQGGDPDVTPRGFTGHEMLDDLGLVHMNGRIYDPLIGRMLSADIVVQFPDSLQSYNRYSYVVNNPLTLTDPTGFEVTQDAVIPFSQLMDNVRHWEANFVEKTHNLVGVEGRLLPFFLAISENSMFPDGVVGGETKAGEADTSRLGWHYIHTSEGWIDMGHFSNAAMYTSAIANVQDFVERIDSEKPEVKRIQEISARIDPETLVKMGGAAVEVGQSLSNFIDDYARDTQTSAMTREDFRSNRLGAEFATFLQANKGNFESLSDALQAFLKDYKPSEQPATDAPDFSELPRSQEQLERAGNDRSVRMNNLNQNLRRNFLSGLWTVFTRSRPPPEDDDDDQ